MISFLRLRCLPGWFLLPCLLAFLGAIWAGRTLFAYAPDMLIIFDAYDTSGKNIESGVWLRSRDGKVPRQPITGEKSQLTRPVGTRLDLVFEYNGQKRTEAVTWRATREYLKWLETELPQRLQQTDPRYDRRRWRELVQRFRNRTTGGKTYYPVIFRAAP